MDILFVTHHYLSGFGGGCYASKAFINAFCDLSTHFTLLFPVKSVGDEMPKEVNPKAKLIPVEYDKPKWSKFMDLLWGKVHRYYNIFNDVVISEHFDVVVFDTSVVSWEMIDIAHRNKCKVITIHHNYQYEYFKDNTNNIIKYPTLYWCKKYERDAVKKSDLNLTLTISDRDLLYLHYDSSHKSKIEVLGTFQYKDDDSEVLVSTTNENIFCITGSLDSKQTKDSIIPWIQNYYPILNEIVPDSKLIIAGKKPDAKLIELCNKNNIQLIPSPKDMNAVMSMAKFYICPVALGGGIKVRIMDGLRNGLKVLTHKVSARGYEMFQDKCLYMYDDLISFQKGLENLLNNHVSSKMVMEEYMQYFSYSAGKMRLFSLVKELIPLK